jgi:hypothetical protein
MVRNSLTNPPPWPDHAVMVPPGHLPDKDEAQPEAMNFA